MYDYSIIGGGLAGCTLAYRLIKEGAKVIVFDSPEHNQSSHIAAGVFNPITGKRMALTWKANEIFDELHLFYPKVEAETNEHFFYEYPLFRLFDNAFDQNEWLTKAKDEIFFNFIDFDIKSMNSNKVNNPFGALQISRAGRLNSQSYLTRMRKWLTNHDAIKDCYLDYSTIKIGKDLVNFGGITSQSVIFCDGSQASTNPYFNYLPHKPVHGEMIEVEIPDFYRDRIISKGIFILPLEANRYLSGSTYNWDLVEPVTTMHGKLELERKLKEVVNQDFKIVSHYAGIRPSTRDRRPYLGAHETHKNLFIFGGFGSKGVSLIPYWSKAFVQYLLNDIDLSSEVDIRRVRKPNE